MKPFVVFGAEFAKRTVVLEHIVGQDKDLMSNGDDSSFASAFRC